MEFRVQKSQQIAKVFDNLTSRSRECGILFDDRDFGNKIGRCVLSMSVCLSVCLSVASQQQHHVSAATPCQFLLRRVIRSHFAGFSFQHGWPQNILVVSTFEDRAEK